ncbi:MAG TPA: hypothetical protein VLW54_15535 [Candidatus Acidoferrales bacterium]|nr:hypothetical protein [Candidatus Acidoferrales bacterium]
MNLSRPRLRWIALLVPAAAILAAATIAPAQNSASGGFPDDWSHHHAVFSYPGTSVDAMRRGEYSRWSRVVSDPRFFLQQRMREAAARGGSPWHAHHRDAGGEPPPPESREHHHEPEAGFPRGVMPAMPLGDERHEPHPHEPHHHRGPQKGAPNNLDLDWSVNLGSGATLGLGVYPAKFSFSISSANCGNAATPDFVVYGTSLAGSGMVGSTQASIVAFDNLYTGCTGTVPSVYWAYDTAGGAVLTSVTFSLDGTQVAFVQTTASAASLVVLKWKASATQTPSAPLVLASTAAASYRACTAPCMTVLPFSGGANDTGSSVYPDYGTDTIYVGDDSGRLHKFTGVFGGTPTEAGGVWPVTVSAGALALSSPVFDPGSGNVLVGDYLPAGGTNCATAGCGFLYRVSAATGAVAQSARMDYVFGVVGAPLVDIAAGTAYVFVGADNGFQSVGSPCGSRVPCSGVFQISTNFSPGAFGTEARTGSGFEFMLPGALDNAFYASANPGSPSGNLYVVGNTGMANNTLFRIPIASNVMGAPVTGPAVSRNFTNGMFAAGMGLTEVFSSGHDYIFTSALLFGAPGTCTSSLTQGCVMGFDVTSGTLPPAALPTGATTEAGGVSAIIIDNASAFSGASNIYYTPLANQACSTGGTGGCAIQISQSSP